MGTQLIAALDNAPQTGVEVCSPLAARTDTPDTREVLRCPQCELVQFRTQNSLCRRCHSGLDAPPPSPAMVRPETVPVAGDTAGEPGIETAEASGVLVPDVAGAIRTWRQRSGLSQRQLAERMRVPRTYVSKIENDKATPTLTSLERIAGAMNTTVACLLDREHASAAVLDDAFVRSLLPYLARLGPQHRERLLAASRHMTQHVC